MAGKIKVVATNGVLMGRFSTEENARRAIAKALAAGSPYDWKIVGSVGVDAAARRTSIIEDDDEM
jgi:hypothetical protein